MSSQGSVTPYAQTWSPKYWQARAAETVTRHLPERPAILVAGLGRCGTTLVVRMLYEAGIPVLEGTAPPSFEGAHWINGRCLAGQAPHTATELAGRVGKWLDPHRTPVPHARDAIVFFLTRNLGEQQLSQEKLVRTMNSSPPLGPAHRRNWRRWLEEEQALALAACTPVAWLTLVSFEGLIAAPVATAAKIADTLAPYYGPLPIGPMVNAIRSRGVECQPTMAIETSLMREWQAANGPEPRA